VIALPGVVFPDGVDASLDVRVEGARAYIAQTGGRRTLTLRAN